MTGPRHVRREQSQTDGGGTKWAERTNQHCGGHMDRDDKVFTLEV